MSSLYRPDGENFQEGQSSVWDDAITMLDDQDHCIRNRGVNVLLHRLSENSRFQLLQEDEESYREGFELLVERLNDENYTVRMLAVTTLAVVLEATEDKDEYKDVYEKSLGLLSRAVGDGDGEAWVSEHAKDIRQELRKKQKKARKDYLRISNSPPNLQ